MDQKNGEERVKIDKWKGLIQLALYLARSLSWHESQTLTGLADDGKGIVLSEQPLQNIPPQLRQWC